MENIKNDYKNQIISFEKAYQLLKKNKQQNLLLEWDLSSENVVKYFDLEFDQTLFTAKKKDSQNEKNRLKKIHNGYKKNAANLKKLVTLYAYVPEIFWWQLPRNKNGSWRKRAVVCYWNIEIPGKNAYTYAELEHNVEYTGLFVKVQNKPTLEIKERPLINTNYNGFNVLKGLKFPEEVKGQLPHLSPTVFEVGLVRKEGKS